MPTLLATARRGGTRAALSLRDVLVRRRRALLVAVGALLLGGLLAPAVSSAGPVEDALDAIFGKLFGGAQSQIGEWFGKWLVDIPNFDTASSGICDVRDGLLQRIEDSGTRVTGTPPECENNLDELRATISVLALGGVSAVLTMSMVRYWLTGFSVSGSGGMEAIEGLSRTVLAVAMILLWPWFFQQSIAVVNSATDALLSLDSVQQNMRIVWGALTILTAAVVTGTGPVGMAIAIFMALSIIALVLALVAMKVFMNVGLSFLYVAMPVFLIMWPIPGMSWMATGAAHAFGITLTIPLIWAIWFAAMAAVGTDVFTFQGNGGGILDAIVIQPLTMIVMFYWSIWIARVLGKMAMTKAISSQAPQRSPGFLSRTASHALGQHFGSGTLKSFPGLQPDSIMGRFGVGKEPGKHRAPSGKSPDAKPAAGKGGGGKHRAPGGKAPGGGGAGALFGVLGKSPTAKPGAGGAAAGGGARAAGGGLAGSLGVAQSFNNPFRRADRAFGGGHPTDNARMAASRAEGKGLLKTIRDDMTNNPAEAGRIAANARQTGQLAASQFSPGQQQALRGILNEGVSGFAAYTSHLSYSPHLTGTQQTAAQTLSGLPESTLGQVLPPTPQAAPSPPPVR
jgi:hypothetical protein